MIVEAVGFIFVFLALNKICQSFQTSNYLLRFFFKGFV